MDTISHRETDANFIDELRRTCESTNINFLLGAGCSMPAFGTLGNIEHLWEMVKTDDTLNGYEKSVLEVAIRSAFFDCAIAANYTYAGSTNTKLIETKQSYKRFCTASINLAKRREATISPKQISYFVTNYDICMDVALDEAKIPTNSGFTGRFNTMLDLSNFGRRYTTSTLTLGYQSELASANLVKLHGCASWTTTHSSTNNTHSICFSISQNYLLDIGTAITNAKLPQIDITNRAKDEYARLKKQVKSGTYIKPSLPIIDALNEQFDKMQIVWPTKDKFHDTVLDEIYYAQLRRLTNQLEVRNSTLLVIGFSFADEHIRKLILRATETNPTLHVIIFCYNEKSERDIKENLLSECDTIPNHNVTTVTAMKPGKGNIQGNLDLNTVSMLLEEVTK